MMNQVQRLVSHLIPLRMMIAALLLATSGNDGRKQVTARTARP